MLFLEFRKIFTDTTKQASLPCKEACCAEKTTHSSGVSKAQNETSLPQCIKPLLSFMLVTIFVNTSKAQLITRHVYVKLLHNNEIVSSNKILKNHAKIGDTIAVSYNPTDHWFKCNKNHKSDTLAIVKGKRYECRAGVVVSKAAVRSGSDLMLNTSL